MRNRFRALFGLTLVVLLLTALGCSTSHKTLIGVIRWDGQAGFAKGQVGEEEQIALGPQRFHYRLPFYATAPDQNHCTLHGDTQEVVDREITLARDAGIDYWAFCWYGNAYYLSKARNLYMRSQVKHKVKCCAIIGNMTWEFDFDELTAAMTQKYYQRVMGGRPLVYALGCNANVISYLRKKCADRGLPTPYVVVMDWSGAGAAKKCDAFGADAIGAYVTPCGGKTLMPYARLAERERIHWSQWAKTGKQVVPIATVGWDPRPRVESIPRSIFAGAYTTVGHSYSTGPQFGAHLRDCLAWVRHHPESCRPNSILCYAWNEFSEGGTLCPKLSGNREHLDALKSVVASAASTP